jgi:hypothetical protein
LTIRTIRHAALLTLLAGGLGVAPVVAQTPDEARAIIRTEGAAYGNGERLVCVATLESSLNPRAVGALGEQGIFQLLSPGLRDTFYARGFTDVWSVAQQAGFAAWAFANGLEGHWAIASRRC